MKRLLGVVVAVILVSGLSLAVVSGQLGRPPARCLHDEDETQANRTRREQALTMARAINAAQGQAFDQTRRYQQLPNLTNLPTVPEGFAVRLQADEDAYIFSIKETRDACRYGIFSDEHGTIYQESPTVPLIAS
jgi:hypothetical protein